MIHINRGMQRAYTMQKSYMILHGGLTLLRHEWMTQDLLQRNAFLFGLEYPLQ